MQTWYRQPYVGLARPRCDRCRNRSAARDRHLRDAQGRRADRAAHAQVGADPVDAREHGEIIPGNGDFLHRGEDLPLFNPEAVGAARVLTRHDVQTTAEDARDEQGPVERA